jgi:hypothetical protein
MSSENMPAKIETSDIEQVIIQGDLSKLNPEQRVRYVQKLCNDTGLNILSRPFDYLNLQGKLVLYANKGATEQLRSVKKISVTVSSREQVGDIFIVTARAKLPDGREDESVGAVNVKGLGGDQLANAFMKAETKAKRRVTLSICGLNMLDETEVETIPRSQRSILPQEVKNEAEEMAQANGTDERMGYRIPFGKFVRKALEEVDIEDLRSYIDYIEKKALKDGKPIVGQVLDFIDRASAYIAAVENGPAPSENSEWTPPEEKQS